MSATKALVVGWCAMFMLAGCLMVPVPGPRGPGVIMAPPLPPVVVLGEEPYYVSGGYYYYYRNNGWAYSHSQRGPWVDLPRDRYPREVRYRDHRDEHGGGRDHEHEGR